MKNKKILRIFFISLGILCALHCIYAACELLFSKNNEETLFCGQVIAKNNYPEYSSKHSHYQGEEFILIINFGKFGIHNINVTTNTYYTTNQGNDVCFTWPKNHFDENRKGVWRALFQMEGAMTIFILIIICIFLLSKFIISVFKN